MMITVSPNRLTKAHIGGSGARQRPGTATDFIFLSMDDETGIAKSGWGDSCEGDAAHGVRR
jgi:hypothetical protein